MRKLRLQCALLSSIKHCSDLAAIRRFSATSEALRPSFAYKCSDRAAQLGLDVKASTTTTTARRRRIADNLELSANQLHCIINPTPFQQFQTGLIHDNFGARAVACFENRIIFGRYRGGVGEGHKVLEAMTAARFNCYPERKLWVGFLSHDFFQTLEMLSAKGRRSK